MCTIGAVIVTYNRLQKLKTALQAYENQLFKPQYILVVNNNSMDGTKDYLEVWEKESSEIEHRVLHLRENTGGSGGFYAGMHVAETMDADWIWVADDDAYPAKDCFQILVNFMKRSSVTDIVALCSAVYTDGRIDTWHRRRFGKRCGVVRVENCIDVKEYERNIFELDLFSYVGTLIKKEVIIKVGLPLKDFFISYDDSEHSIRVRKQGRIMCLPEAKVIHDSIESAEDIITWKKYYALRNKIYSYYLHFGLLQSGFQRLYYYIKYHKNIVLNEMTKRAFDHAKHGILGIDEIYKPGWKGNVI